VLWRCGLSLPPGFRLGGRLRARTGKCSAISRAFSYVLNPTQLQTLSRALRMSPPNTAPVCALPAPKERPGVRNTGPVSKLFVR
jgi:hypothetical protein